jgi:hypothetical protein
MTNLSRGIVEISTLVSSRRPGYALPAGIAPGPSPAGGTHPDARGDRRAPAQHERAGDALRALHGGDPELDLRPTVRTADRLAMTLPHEMRHA